MLARRYLPQISWQKEQFFPNHGMFYQGMFFSSESENLRNFSQMCKFFVTSLNLMLVSLKNSICHHNQHFDSCCILHDFQSFSMCQILKYLNHPYVSKSTFNYFEVDTLLMINSTIFRQERISIQFGTFYKLHRSRKKQLLNDVLKELT